MTSPHCESLPCNDMLTHPIKSRRASLRVRHILVAHIAVTLISKLHPAKRKFEWLVNLRTTLVRIFHFPALYAEPVGNQYSGILTNPSSTPQIYLTMAKGNKYSYRVIIKTTVIGITWGNIHTNAIQNGFLSNAWPE